MRALFASLPFVPAAQAELERLRDELAGWDAASVPPSMFLVFAMHNGLHPAIRLYLLGMLEARLERRAAAEEQAAALDSLAESGGALVRSFAVELRARIAQMDGKAEQGVALLEGSRPELWFQLTVASPFFSLASRRYLHAELLREVGRTEEAAGWYAAIAQRSPYELIYAAQAQVRLAEMAAALGDKVAAERHRRRAGSVGQADSRTVGQ
jgi:tetratricopeptide (TPR) repeat protein